MNWLIAIIAAAVVLASTGLGQTPPPIVRSEWTTNNPVPLKWQDMRIPMASMRVGAAAPTAKNFAGTVRAYAFGPTTDSSVEFEMQVPHGVETNVLATNGLRFHLHWSATNCVGVAATNVVWGLEYAFANPYGAFPATSTMYATNFIATNWAHMMSIFPRITNAIIPDSTVFVGRLFRDADNGSDQLPEDAYGISLDAHYQIRKFGSDAEFGD